MVSKTMMQINEKKQCKSKRQSVQYQIETRLVNLEKVA